MSKRPNTSSPAPAPLNRDIKRPRKAAGFRFARLPGADSGSESQPTTSSSSSSLFVTVTQNESRRGILTRSKVITSDFETVEPTQSTIPPTNPQIQDFCNEITHDLTSDGPEAAANDPVEATKEPKRKRQTTNYVRPSKKCTVLMFELIRDASRTYSKNGYHSGTFSWMRFSDTMVLVIFWVIQNVRNARYMMASLNVRIVTTEGC
jgi:hypothetical protein